MPVRCRAAAWGESASARVWVWVRQHRGRGGEWWGGREGARPWAPVVEDARRGLAVVQWLGGRGALNLDVLKCFVRMDLPSHHGSIVFSCIN